ncbi:metallophosphoesterase family protein [Vibrio sp. TRT 17S01]|uniref:metallophosphoesterase family protein n=1 Tax=Vibrio sp. TRT 17S01 TaxID=3418505 RepID=UPI003CEAC647
MHKLAVVSDIHSNIFALEAVIQHAFQLGVTDFVNLGDILYGPIAPRKTYERLLELNALTISGNQDRQIYQSTQEDIAANPTLQFILEDLGQAPLEWMKDLPFDCNITDEIYACHGTPTDDLEYLLEETQKGFPVLRSDDEILRRLAGNKAPIILCGHTHIPRCVELSSGQLVINPGSVGLQAYTDDEPYLHSMENYSSMASYAILEQTKQGTWHVAFHRVGYDVSSAVACAINNNRKDWAHFLKTGRK